MKNFIAQKNHSMIKKKRYGTHVMAGFVQNILEWNIKQVKINISCKNVQDMYLIYKYL